MARPVHITNNIERRTYVKGNLLAKYIGFLDESNSDKSHLNFYDIEILEAKVEIKSKDIRKWQEGGVFEEFRSLESFPSKLPADTDFCIVYDTGQDKHFRLNLLDLRIKDPDIKDRIVEEEKVFGTLTGEICGYFLHYDQETKIIYVDDDSEEGSNPPQDGPSKGSPPNARSTSVGLMDVLQGLASVITTALGFLMIVPLILYGWPLLVIAGLVYGLTYLSSALPKVTQRIAGAFNSLLLLLFLLLFVAGLVSYINQGTVVPSVVPADQSNEQSGFAPLPQPLQDSLQSSGNQPFDSTSFALQDSLRMHYRVWKGYKGEIYSGYLSVRLSDFRASSYFRNQVVQPVMPPLGFGEVYGGLDQHDRPRLTHLYSLFDSIQQTNNLDQTKFAEMVVSCIQDIPYTLILPQECSPWIYQDAFIREYLNAGGKCRPNEKYGVLSPIEFVYTLDGDCDTRALLLYSVLKQYGYDVALLVSDHYQHAILGINLPYRGLAKVINNKRYVVWETTNEGMPPGILPRQISNMNFWQPALISNQ
ncbi:MAG: hypothetical protein J0M29_00375 [Chitinophagales bacterium]|nr:hypothetical protein [Chitinophagales bacterium]